MRPAPRVQCDDCRFAWYGASAADGLRVVGTCPKCGGHLEFLASDAPASAFAVSERLSAVAPASVLGLPHSWAGR
jgi:hypothetical protein